LRKETDLFCSKCGKETIEGAAFCAGCGASLTGVQPKKRILSTIAGIVEIVAGVFTGITAIIYLVAMFVAEDMPGWFVFFPVLTLVILCMLAVVGGICALRRKYWAMALVGAIAVIWPTVVLGIAAVVLNIAARDEFKQ
jgi:hypothetical protein